MRSLAILLIVLFAPFTAFATSCTSGVFWNSSPANSNQLSTANTCDSVFGAMSAGAQFTVTGSSNNDGTYTFSSWQINGGGYGQGSIFVTGSWLNPGVDDTGRTVTFATVSASIVASFLGGLVHVFGIF